MKRFLFHSSHNEIKSKSCVKDLCLKGSHCVRVVTMFYTVALCFQSLL